MKLSDVKAGDTVFVDDGFPCMARGPKTVKMRDQYSNLLYIDCEADGRPAAHFLHSEEGKNAHLIGFGLTQDEADRSRKEYGP